MASFRKTASGWQAQIAIKGNREAKTFSTKAEATAWAAQRETEIRRQVATGIDAKKSVGDAFDRYGKEVSIRKKKPRWEQVRLAALGAAQIDHRRLNEVPLNELTADMLGRWRDKRLNVDKVLGSTINRDFALLSNVFAVAQKEWKWMGESPTRDVRRPKDPPPRDRRIEDDEIERITLASGFCEMPAHQVKQRVGIAFLYAIETAMRAGEICSLTEDLIKGPVARLLDTKNGTARDVPMSKRARELIGFLPAVEKGQRIFGLTPSQLDANFRKLREAACIDGLTFHDTRHEAITRLAKKLNVLELARMVGHRDLKMLQIYYNETAENLAARLD